MTQRTHSPELCSCRAPSHGLVTLAGAAGVTTFPACTACATDLLATARCSVRWIPTATTVR